MRVIQYVLIALLTLSVPSVASAKKDNHPGRSHGQPQGQVHGGNNSGPAADFRFTASERRAVDDYFGQQFRAGKCPPGLAKKGKGCVPPGQARKWRKGQPLPRDVSTYPLPHDLLVRLPAPPIGQEYVRVANDILMIATGTSMVIDAIQDIGR